MAERQYKQVSETNYLYKASDGVLQHGHPQSKPPYTVQWHPAHTQHRADPDAHAKYNSFGPDLVKWSQQNYDLTDELKRHLVYLARKAHNDGFTPNYSRALAVTIQPMPSPVAPENMPQQQPAPYTPEPPAPVPTLPTDTDAEVPDLQLLEERVANIEELAINVLEPLEPRLKRLEDTERRLDDARERTTNAVTQAHDSIRELRRDMTEALTKLDITEQIAPLQARVEQLEQTAKREQVFVVRQPDGNEHRLEGLKHEKFELLLELATKLSPSRRNIWISGPAGSGKTTGAEQLAQALGLPYEYIGAIDTPYKLSGYRTAVGEYLDTAFRRQYQTGGVILLDEVDGSSPSALLEINAALANGAAAFPDGLIKRHPNTIVLCAANTWGHGGNANYVGRMKQDVAFLSRFVKVNWTYDEVLERAASGSPTDWVSAVQATRALAMTHKAQFVISPRASITGCELLRNGMRAEQVAEALFSDYMQDPMWSNVGKPITDYVGHYARQQPAPTRKPLPVISPPQPPRTPSPLENVDFSEVRVFGT